MWIHDAETLLEAFDFLFALRLEHQVEQLGIVRRVNGGGGTLLWDTRAGAHHHRVHPIGGLVGGHERHHAAQHMQAVLANSYFHPGHTHLIPFAFARTFGVFQYTFGQLAVGDIAGVLFIAMMMTVCLPFTSTAFIAPSTLAMRRFAGISFSSLMPTMTRSMYGS